MSPRTASVLIAAALIASVASGAADVRAADTRSVSAAGVQATSTGASGTVTSRRGNLIHRPAGMPTTSEPARQLSSAVVAQHLTTSRVTATIVLNGAPAPGTSADLWVVFGRLTANNCAGERAVVTTTTGGLAPGFTRSGATFTLGTDQMIGAGYEDWDCAFVELAPNGSTASYDVLIGPLNDVYGKPRLRIAKVELLRSKVKRLKLVPRVWTTLDVTVRNSGVADAPGVRVTGAGKGLKVKPARVGKLEPGSVRSGQMKVKLTRKGRRAMKLVARGGGVKGARKIAVRSVPRPRRPVPGAYRSKDGAVTFRIAKGRVVGWRGRMQTRCGGYPGLPTYTMNTYDFPRTKIPRNGIVQAFDRGDLYGARLELKAVGRRVSKGYFSYSGPNRCFAVTTFAAKRAGR